MLSQRQPKMFRLEQCLHKLCQGTRKGTDRSRFARDSQPFTTLLSQSSFTRCTKKSSRVLVGGRGGGKNRQIPKDSLQVPPSTHHLWELQGELLPGHRMGTATFPLSASVWQLNLILNVNYRGLLAKIRPDARDKISKHTARICTTACCTRAFHSSEKCWNIPSGFCPEQRFVLCQKT